MKPTALNVTHHTVTLRSLRMHYVSAGTGPTVVLLHGFPESWLCFRNQIEPLVRAGFRVIAPDQRGYGETDTRGPYDLDTLSNDVCELIEAVEGKRPVSIVGHDWGGAVAWHLAAFRPEFCERLTVLNCPHPLRMQQAFVGKPKLRQIKRSWYMFFFQLPWLPEWLLKRNGAALIERMFFAAAVDRSRFTSEELAAYRENFLKPGAASAMIGWYRAAIRGSLPSLFSPRRYPAISAPTTLIWAMGDPALGFDDVVPGTERLAPKLVIKPIEHCGHFVLSERPEEATPLILQSLSR